MSATVDTSGLEQTMIDLANAVKEDGGEFLRGEAARLSEEAALQLSRRGKTPGEHTIKKDVAAVFMPEPDKVFKDHRASGNGMLWLYATPHDLFGIKPDNDMRSGGVADMRRVFYPAFTFPAKRSKLIATRQTSNRTTKAGKKLSSQRVKEFERLMVTKGNFRKFIAYLKSHKGRLEASFADTARQLRGIAKVPAKVARHLPSETNITRNGTDNKIFPWVELGSFAPGVTRFAGFIETAIRIRTEKMKLRLGYIKTGYANAKRAGRITPQAKIISIAG